MPGTSNLFCAEPGVGFHLPRFYAIVDAAWSRKTGSDSLKITQALVEGGATLIQYRNKSDLSRVIVGEARELRRVAAGSGVTFIMNDRPDLCVAASFDGVHLGQEDLSPLGARRVVGSARVLGLSTHGPRQVLIANESPVDYIAIGPIFTTHSKENPDPVIGLEGIRAVRLLTRKPLVAIGGITLANCRSVIAAGADSVAVISEILRDTRAATEAFIRNLA